MPTRTPRTARFVVIDETPHPCPYLPGREATLPLRLPLSTLSGQVFDTLLAQGDRRAGPCLYRTACRGCSACEALRVPVSGFRPSKSQRRAIAKNSDLRIEVGRPTASEDRVALYNRHKSERGLDQGEGPLSVEDYRRHYVESCAETVEVLYLAGDRLVALSILDLGVRSASSVYHCFDPDESRRSLGVYSVCREIELCRELGLEWYYLGLWVKDCGPLTYKAQYFPHERLGPEGWIRHEEPSQAISSGVPDGG